MAIRSEALSCDVFAKLKSVYDNRRAVLADWKAVGKKPVLVMGYDVPDEIILATGMMPFRVTGYYGGERKSAEKYLEYSFGAIWKGLFESFTEDYAGLADYAVFSSSSDMFLKLFYYLRTMKRMEPERVLPQLKYLDYELVEKRMKTQFRNERELRDLVETVENWSGSKVTEDGLKAAIALCNEYRQVLRAFSALRHGEDCCVTGSEALVVIGATLFMEKAEAIEAVKQVTECAKSWPKVEAARCYYVGSPQEITEVYELAEACGLNFVGEDHDMGDRMFDTDVNESYEPISALAARLIERMPSSEKGNVKERALQVGQKVRETGAQVLLTYMNNNDEAYVWDYPTLKKTELEPMGIPSAVVQKQTWPLSNVEELKAQLTELAKEAK